MRKLMLLSCAVLSLCLILCGCAGGGSSLPNISQAEPSAPPSVGEGKAAVYIYMCGSTLETKQGAATKNIAELLSADVPENTCVIIQTGGAKTWRGYDVSPNNITRYEITDGEFCEKQRLENASMGGEQTLRDFIDYCVSEYPAEKSALILWDHGGGALGEVCYDENFSMDSLTPEELRGALSGRHFDLIGFDACLMAANETAAVVKDHADYMIASEEIEPTGGWDYRALAENFSAETSVEDTGKAVCDAYLKKCSSSVGGDMATLSLFDLSRYDRFSAAFDEFSKSLSETSGERYGNFSVVRASEQAPKFGADSRDEGQSNLIDLYGFANSLADNNPSALALKNAIEDLVPYKVGGAGRGGLGGVSLFFPHGYISAELQKYLELCSSDAYRGYLSGIYSEIDNVSVSFSDTGSIDDSGNFRVQLSEDSRKYLKTVGFALLKFTYDQNSEEKIKLVCLGEDNDIDSDWDNLTFTSNFRGVWLALDGVYLNYSVIDSSRDYIIFSAPVNVNGKRSNLRFMFVWDDNFTGGGYYKIIGLWDGLDENNLADKQITPLSPGDEITVLQKRVDPETDVTISDAPLSEGDTVIIGENGGEIRELPLTDDGYYRYVFIADDIFGNRFYSNTANFEMKYTFDELLQTPLPDGECAAEITDIDWDSYWGAVG